MTRYLVAYLAATVVLVAIDMLWLGVIAKDMYRQGIGHLMAENMNLVAGVCFYLLYPIGIVIFAVAANPGGSWLHSALMGAMFGFFAYATYDLTNLATLKDWPLGLALTDMAWGTFVSGVSAVAARLAWQAMSK